MHTTLIGWMTDARRPENDLDTSVAAADARFAAFGDDPAAIPTGTYCYFGATRTQVGQDAQGFPLYRTVPCPFWAANPNAPEQGYGYCAKLRSGDWMEGGTSLLWDQCKECGVNDPDEAYDDQVDA